jgi:thioredoxin-like negative regulator of GroEL
MNKAFSYCTQCDTINRIIHGNNSNYLPICGNCFRELPIKAFVTEVSAKGFREILRKSDQIVVVYFWASWKKHNDYYVNIFEKVSQRFGRVATFIKLNMEISQDIVYQYEVHNALATSVFKNGQEMRRETGPLLERYLVKFVEHFIQ